MKFLADENVDQQIVASLRSSGHDVVYIAELDPGITDEQVLALANGQGCLLITEDKDFGELVFRMRRQSHGKLQPGLSQLMVRNCGNHLPLLPETACVSVANVDYRIAGPQTFHKEIS